ncbi:hypothetical protein E4T56_gene20990, partial [Termitomyces sp. T112]
VSAEELAEWRRDFPSGRRAIRVEPSQFRLADYRAFLAENAQGIAEFEARREAAFAQEREDWQRKGEFDRVSSLNEEDAPQTADITLPEGSELIEAPFGGSVWKLLVAPGDESRQRHHRRALHGRKAIPATGRADAGAAEARMNRQSATNIAAAIRSGQTSAVEVARDVLARLAAYDAIQPQIWISRASPETLLAAAAAIDARVAAGEDLPLAGVALAVKDNIDVAGFETTAACPSFAYLPEKSAPVVERLLAAGAICIGKTNLDQFATGLRGVQLWFLGGGGGRIVAFALGTDTAGSGRVPAAFNHLTGFKPTKGRWSTSGLVPACRTLDCITVFTDDTKDARLIDGVVAGFDPADPYSKPLADRPRAAQTIGVPRRDQRLFFGDAESEYLYDRALEKLSAQGRIVEIDMAPLQEAAQLLYGGPWVAERSAAIAGLLAQNPEAIDP